MRLVKEWLKRNRTIVRIYECIALRIKAVKEQLVRVVIYRPKTKCSYGEKNKDKTFMVIPVSETSGLYSNISIALPIMQYAIKRGFIPVIDYQNTFSDAIQDIENKGLENAWEYYYEQPARVSLEEVYQSKRVIHYSREAYYVKKPRWFSTLPISDQELQYWHKFVMENIRLQRSIEERIEQEAAKIFVGKKKILGVGVRAGFLSLYLSKSPKIEGHPIVPTCEEMIKIVEAKMKEWGYEYIYLHADDREYQQKFVNYFGDKCLFMERHLKHWFSNDMPLMTPEEIHCEYKGISVREETEEYMIGVYLLSMCDSLYCSQGGGTYFAYLLNGGRYEHVEIYDEGRFHL